MDKLKIPTLAVASLAAVVFAVATPTPVLAAEGGGSAYCFLHIPSCSVHDSTAWFSGCSGNYPEGDILSWFAQEICTEWHAQ